MAEVQLPLQIDELYFSTCAARGLYTGEIPISGCHDTKPPFIFWIHQLVQLSFGVHVLLNMKIAAFSCVGIIVVLVGCITFRVAGLVAALIGSALVMQVFALDGSFSALKTESIGAIFLLIGILTLVRDRGKLSLLTLWFASILFGCAILSKQTFAFAVIGLVFSLCWTWRRRILTDTTEFSKRIAVVVLGTIAPVACMVFFFWTKDRHIDLLASMFVYPSLYGVPDPAHWFRKLAWKVGLLATFLQPMSLVNFLAIAAISDRLKPEESAAAVDFAAISPVGLIASIAISMFGVLLVAPVLFRAHLLPFWIVVSILGGIYSNNLFKHPKQIKFGDLVSVSLVLLGLSFVNALASYGGQEKISVRESYFSFEKIENSRNKYAYVVGIWPSFYFFNGLIPASDILYPTALPGTPESWAYVPPLPGSLKQQIVVALQNRNVKRLADDFSRTPPSYIMVIDIWARSKNSKNLADVAFINQYLLNRCSPWRVVSGTKEEAGILYMCS